jgi:hypothetical protein
MCGDEKRDTSRLEANASLIAAAPDLLGALRFVLAFYEPGQTHLDTEAWKCAEASARAAVAKAFAFPVVERTQKDTER